MGEMDFSNWAYSKKGVFCQQPPYLEHVVDTKALFKHFGSSLYIRWDSNFDQCDNHYYYHVIKEGDCSIESMPAKTRNMIRRCLSNCTVRQVDYQSVINGGGYDVYLSELRRYKKKGFAQNQSTEDQWINGMKSSASKGYDIWAVFFEARVISYALCRRQERHVNLVTWKCDYENYNSLYPSYGLIYKMLDYYLSQSDIWYVDDGGRSLTDHSAVQDFLISRFSFRMAYTKLNARFRWWLYIPLVLLCPFENIIKNNELRSIVRLYKWSK